MLIIVFTFNFTMSMNRASPDANGNRSTFAGTPGESLRPPHRQHRATASPQEPRAGARRARRGDKAELPIKKKAQVSWFGDDRKIKVNAAT